MIIKVTEIEATAEELKQCNSLADGAAAMLKQVFSGFLTYHEPEADEEEADG